LLLWPTVWNQYPIVFADTGTYLSQAIHRYLGWDRPVFYSLFMLPLHLTISTWPVVVVQAMITAWMLHLVHRALLPAWRSWWLIAPASGLTVLTWLPFLPSTLMPDVFTPLLILVLCLLAFVPTRLTRVEQAALLLGAVFMIAAQQSSILLYGTLLPAALLLRHRLRVPGSTRRLRVSPADELVCRTSAAPPALARAGIPRLLRRPTKAADSAAQSLGPATGPAGTAAVPPWTAPHGRPAAPIGTARSNGSRHVRGMPAGLLLTPLVVALLILLAVNAAGHGRAAVSPFGNVFILARVIYDGPGMAILHRNCPESGWRLCPFLDRLPATSDDFLWRPDSPIILAGGHKAVSAEAGAIIAAAVRAAPLVQLHALTGNVAEQLQRFASGDGLEAWPAEVTPWIERSFPRFEREAYATARQQRGSLGVPDWLARLHVLTATLGVAGCALLLPPALRRRHPCAGFLILILLALPISAIITGGLSTPHDRYQARLMWLPPLVAAVSAVALRRA